jgi:SAM-dependent methyltransferase
MHELSKSIARRMHEPGFVSHYFAGMAIDIGAGQDSLAQYREQFPLLASVRAWDKNDGDAEHMDGVPDGLFDLVHSSHCLEHLADPVRALRNWFRILKPGGYLVCMVPDEDLYEQGVWPSSYSWGHQYTFTICKPREGEHKSWSPVSVNLVGLLAGTGQEILKIQQLWQTWRRELPRCDQTQTVIGESAIEFVMRKRQA